jgi:hypothetical protein
MVLGFAWHARYEGLARKTLSHVSRHYFMVVVTSPALHLQPSILPTRLSHTTEVTMTAYEAYESKLAEIGEAILSWADNERKFRGYTEVRST